MDLVVAAALHPEELPQLGGAVAVHDDQLGRLEGGEAAERAGAQDVGLEGDLGRRVEGEIEAHAAAPARSGWSRI